MRWIRTIFGIIAVVSLCVGLNFVVLNESVFTPSVMNAFKVAGASGFLWLVLYLAGLVRRGTKNGTPFGLNSVISCIAVLVICITLYAFVKRMDISLDLTNEGRRELSSQTRLVLESLTKPVEVYCVFVKAGDNRSIIAQGKTVRFLEQCQRLTDNMTIQKLDPQKDLAKMEALQVLRVSDVGTVIIKSGNRQREIPLSHVNARLEERDFTNALINVSRNETPKIYFLDGHEGHDIDSDDEKGSHLFKKLLLHESYEVAKFTILRESPFIPDDCSLLIINHYTSDLTNYEISAFNQYIDDGGRLLVLINPSVAIDQGVPTQEHLRPWLLTRFGIDVFEDIIVSALTKNLQTTLLDDFSHLKEYKDDAPNAIEFRGSFHSTHPITRNIDVRMDMRQLRTVQLQDPLPERVTGTSLLRTSPDTWGESDIQAIVENRPISHDTYEVDGPNTFAVSAVYKTERATMQGTRSQDARIVVMGDADLALNQYIGFPGSTDFILNTVAWLTENEDLIAIRPRGTEGQVLSLTLAEQRGIVWLSVLGILQVIVAIAMLTFLYRRRYQ